MEQEIDTTSIRDIEIVEGSPSFSISLAELKSVGIGLGVAIAGAILTYLSEAITQYDYEFSYRGVLVDLTPVAVAGWSVVANFLRKFVGDHTGIFVGREASE